MNTLRRRWPRPWTPSPRHKGPASDADLLLYHGVPGRTPGAPNWSWATPAELHRLARRQPIAQRAMAANVVTEANPTFSGRR
jgi:hypothetical protein